MSSGEFLWLRLVRSFSYCHTGNTLETTLPVVDGTPRAMMSLPKI
jgi:hypothetical protein